MSSEELADRFHLLLRVRARDLAPPAGFVVQKGSAGAPPGVCRSVAKVCPSWGPHVEPGERKDAHRKASVKATKVKATSKTQPRASFVNPV